MLRIPDDIAACSEMAMGAGGVRDAVHPHFRKWLRFYLNFCAKYGFEPSAEPSFPLKRAGLAAKALFKASVRVSKIGVDRP